MEGEPIKTFRGKISFPTQRFQQVYKRGIFHAALRIVTFDGVKLVV